MEQSTYEEFFRYVHPLILRYATGQVGPDLAKDIAQQTMLTVWNKDLDDPRSEVERKQLASLAYRIADGHIRNTVRGESRFRRLLSKVVDDQTTPITEVTEVSLGELDRDQLLAGLPPGVLEVLESYLDGNSVSEIADDLGLSSNAVSARLSRARRHLKAARDGRVGDAAGS